MFDGAFAALSGVMVVKDTVSWCGNQNKSRKRLLKGKQMFVDWVSRKKFLWQERVKEDGFRAFGWCGAGLRRGSGLSH